MERNTQTFTSPANVEFDIVEKLNAQERNELRDIIFEATKMSAVQENQPAGVILPAGEVAPVPRSVVRREMDLRFVSKMEQALIRLTVKRYGETSGGQAVLTALLEGDPEEYDFVNKKAEEVHSKALSDFFKTQ